MSKLIGEVLAVTLAAILVPAVAVAQTVTQSLVFEWPCLDLDTGLVEESCNDAVTENTTWDIVIAYNADREVHAVILQNGSNNLEIAFLEGSAFAAVSAADIADAPFTPDVVDQPFDGSAVVLVRTDEGAVFKLGNPSEDDTGVTFSYEQIQ